MDHYVAVKNYVSMKCTFFAHINSQVFSTTNIVFVATFSPCMNDSLIQITPPFFSNYDFFPRHFQFTEIIKQFDGIYFNKFFFRTDIDDKIINNIGILHSYFITLQKY